MSSDIAPPLPPRPSVFLSYASEDRAAARTLRDALAATGLEVWYDENELGGGDAWDQKIRRQIRDCDYFLPMISAATEARKEGYFRREWRLAAERTLDMADDVMFLLPVVIDGTDESGARVPDKFLTVQWLRLPGGQPTPALHALCRRLLASEHHAPPRRPAAPSATAAIPPAPAPHPHTPPPMPPFPHPPEKGIGHSVKFLAEAAWWLLSACWILFKRAPKWLRVLFTIWFVFFLVSRCGRDTVEINTGDKKPARVRTKDVSAAIKTAAESAKSESDLTPADVAKLGAEFARGLAAGLDPKTAAPSAKSLAVVPFALGLTGEPATKFADAVFTATYGRLALARPADTAQVPDAAPTTTDTALAILAKKTSAAHILAARITDTASRELEVRLLRTKDAALLWSATYPLDLATAPAVSEQVATAVLAALPAK